MISYIQWTKYFKKVKKKKFLIAKCLWQNNQKKVFFVGVLTALVHMIRKFDIRSVRSSKRKNKIFVDNFVHQIRVLS